MINKCKLSYLSLLMMWIVCCHCRRQWHRTKWTCFIGTLLMISLFHMYPRFFPNCLNWWAWFSAICLYEDGVHFRWWWRENWTSGSEYVTVLLMLAVEYKVIFYLRQAGYAVNDVCVCVPEITHRVMDRLWWSFVDQQSIRQDRTA